jgi:photosystem II stability/assembly factor-like uncharacterized protein
MFVLGLWLAVLAVTSVLLNSGAVAQSGEAPGWTRLGSVPAEAWSLAPDGRNASIIFAHGPNGISRSTDRGSTWSLCSADARSLSVLTPPNGQAGATVLYAATPGGLRTSDDGCLTWRDVPSAGIQPKGSNTNWLAPYPNNYSVLYAGMNGLGGLYRSTDAGATWQPAASGLPPAAHVTSLTADPLTPENLVVGLRYDTERHPPAYIYRSTDGGLTWRSSSIGIDVLPNNGCRVTGLAWSGPDLYAATLHDGIFRSSDRGMTWQRAATPQRTSGRTSPHTGSRIEGPVSIHRLVGTARGILLISTGEGAYQSLDGGRSWTNFGPRELSGVPLLLGVEPNSGRVVAAGEDGAWAYTLADSDAQARTPTTAGVANLPPTPPPPPQLPTATPAPPTATPTVTPVPPTSTPAPVEGPKPSDPVPPGDPAVSDFFPETGHNIRYGFRDFWRANGGLGLFGYPITEEFVENGIPVQYFERVRLEYRDGRVQLALLGREVTAGTFFRTVPFFPSEDDNVYFGATGHSLGGPFLEFWRENGRETIFGYPISEPFREDGSEYQWFERGRFEWHPYLPEDSRIVLGNIGTESLKKRGWLR